MFTESKSKDSYWKILSSTLQLRRNLQSSLTPPENIGKNAVPKPYESESSFKERINASRKSHKDQSDALREVHNLKTDKDVQEKIEELKMQENRLWVQCRPDLYKLGDDGELINKFDEDGKFID